MFLIKFKSFDPISLDICLKSLVNTLTSLSFKVAVARTPTRRLHVVIQSSPHIDKIGKNAFTHVIHTRVLTISGCISNKLKRFIVNFAKTKQFEVTFQIKPEQFS
jgi:ribosomal protein S10